MTEPHLKTLGINPMVQQNREAMRTAFTVSVDAAEGITTGISAYDRARTIAVLASPDTRPEQLVQPGHIFPLRARPGGVLERAGHTEAAVDLASLAGLHPSGVICEILNEDGAVARQPDLVTFKQLHGLRMISIASLIEYRHHREQLVELLGTRPFATAHGPFTLHLFRSKLDSRQHLALTLGQLGPDPTLVRVHSENILGDVFQQTGANSHHTLHASLRAIAAAGRGVLLYMGRHESPAELLRRLDTRLGEAPPMGLRDYGLGAQILSALGLKKIRLLSNSSRRAVGLDGYNLEITEQVPL